MYTTATTGIVLAAWVAAAGSWSAPAGLSGPACPTSATPQQLAGRASPLDSVETTLAGGVLKVCYGRPSARGRPVAGNLVPYNEPWRFGANEPTTIFVPFAVEIAGVRVDSGAYSLYVVAHQADWEIHVNRSINRWGIPIDAQVQAQDVGKGTVPVEPLAQHVEQLTLRFGPVAGTATELIVEWEKMRVRIPIRKVPA